jgi:hypothetical protein
MWIHTMKGTFANYSSLHTALVQFHYWKATCCNVCPRILRADGKWRCQGSCSQKKVSLNEQNMSFKPPFRAKLPQFSLPSRLLGSRGSQRVNPVLFRGFPAKSFICKESDCTLDGVDLAHCVTQGGCLATLNIPWLRSLFSTDTAPLL